MQFFNQDFEFFEENRECSYFDNESSDIRYQFLNSCSSENYQNKLERGWRRFGKVHFVPECRSCTKCVSIRIDVANFKFSKSQKRVLAKNRDTKISIRNPSEGLVEKIKQNIPFESAISFIVFVMLYIPCLAAAMVFTKEAGSWKYLLYLFIFTTSTAWIVSFVAYNITKLVVA